MTKEEAPKTEKVVEIKGSQQEVKLVMTGIQPEAKSPDKITGNIVWKGNTGAAEGVLFIIAKRASGGGPPVAVKKIDNPKFPMNFLRLERKI